MKINITQATSTPSRTNKKGGSANMGREQNNRRERTEELFWRFVKSQKYVDEPLFSNKK